MTWSLKIKNGDLVATGGRLDVVDNENKMVQDLKCQLLEKMGSDILHPTYGSLIDGGVDQNGIVHDSLIGTDNIGMVQLMIQSEIQRIVGEYQSRQLNRARSDKKTYNKQTLTYREVVQGIQDIQFVQNLDKLTVRITLSTLGNSTETIDLTLAN